MLGEFFGAYLGSRAANNPNSVRNRMSARDRDDIAEAARRNDPAHLEYVTQQKKHGFLGELYYLATGRWPE